jgi:hypothetical protein
MAKRRLTGAECWASASRQYALLAKREQRSPESRLCPIGRRHCLHSLSMLCHYAFPRFIDKTKVQQRPYLALNPSALDTCEAHSHLIVRQTAIGRATARLPRFRRRSNLGDLNTRWNGVYMYGPLLPRTKTRSPPRTDTRTRRALTPSCDLRSALYMPRATSSPVPIDLTPVVTGATCALDEDVDTTH